MIARGAYRLPVLPAILTGLLFGAGVGALSGLVSGGVSQSGFGGVAFAGFILGLMAGPVIGLTSTAVGLIAAAVYSRVNGRSRQALIATTALAAAITAVALLLAIVVSLSTTVPLWWLLVHGVAVFAITAFQAHLLITASKRRRAPASAFADAHTRGLRHTGA